MSDDDQHIDVTDEQALRYSHTIAQVGPKVKEVREHLFGGFPAAGPTS